MKNIDFYFDFISPYTYLAVTQMANFQAGHDVKINWLPINLPQLIKISDNVGPATIKNKALYSLHDIKRWAAYLDVPFKMIRPGSFDSRPASKIAAALEGEDRVRFCTALFEAIWSGEINVKQDDWLDQAFKLKGLPEAWRSLSLDVIDENTAQACKAGAFGAPTFVLHGTGRAQLFFGVDRMDFLGRACQQS